MSGLDNLHRELGIPVGTRVASMCRPPCPVCDDVHAWMTLAYGALVLREAAGREGQATLQEVLVGP